MLIKKDDDDNINNSDDDLTSLLCLFTLDSQSYLSSSTTPIFEWSSWQRFWGWQRFSHFYNSQNCFFKLFVCGLQPLLVAHPATIQTLSKGGFSHQDSALSPPPSPVSPSPSPRRLLQGGASDWTKETRTKLSRLIAWFKVPKCYVVKLHDSLKKRKKWTAF